MMKRVLAAMVALTLGGSVTALAADKKPADKPADKAEAKPVDKAEAKKAPAKADVSGSWTWSFQGRDGQARESKLNLKAEGDKLTGTISGRGGDTAIQDGKLGKDGAVSFKVERERNGEKIVARYEGKFDGSLIKGTQSSNFGGQDQQRPWEAKRGN